jgi:hypothetical protein
MVAGFIRLFQNSLKNEQETRIQDQVFGVLAFLFAQKLPQPEMRADQDIFIRSGDFNESPWRVIGR